MAFSFDQIFAADPANPANIAQNASITIFAPGDATMTPLTITDPDGQPLANPIPVNANGFGSAFAHATLDRVAWAGGGFTGFFTSYEGMKGEAVAARAAAEQAAATAALTATNEVEQRIAAGEFQGAPGANGLNGSNVLPTSEAIEQAIVTDGPARAALKDTFAPKWKPSTTYTAGEAATSPDGIVVRAKAAFTSGTQFDATKWEYGTLPGGGNIPVVKSSTDTRPGVWEYTHNSTTGYLFHLLAGANFGSPAAILAIGNDNGTGTSILLPNKAGGKAIVIDQRSTVVSATAYGFHATQSSTAAPLVRLEQNVPNAAPALQVMAFGGPTATQVLAYFGDASGEAGIIFANSGKIKWNRDIRIVNQATGETPSYLELSTSASANSSNTKKTWLGADFDVLFGATGAAGQYYPYRVAHNGSSYQIQTAPNLVPADPVNPKPSEVSTWTSQFSVGHNTLSFFGATKVKKTGWTPATGTATRTTFDTTTVTLPELAQRVKALIDDLHATAGYGLLQS